MLRHLQVIAALLSFGVALSAAVPTQAALTLVTSRAALGGDDFIDWGLLGAPQTVVNSPFAITSNLGLSITGSMPSGSLKRVDQGSGWNGGFAGGTRLLSTQANNGPLTLSFSGQVMGGGADFQPALFFTNGGKIGIEAFDALDNSLGSFSINWTFDLTQCGGDLSCEALIAELGQSRTSFVGVLSDSADIHKIALSIGASEQGFAINKFDIVRDQSAPVSEPATLATLGIGLLGLSALRRRTV